MEKSDNERVTDDDDVDKDHDFEIKDYQDDVYSDESFEGYDDDNENAATEGGESEADGEYTGPILPGGHRFDTKLLCVKYPGVVENASKAVETLGGLPAISTAFDTENRRLELRFRPDDCYRKPTCGDRHHTAGFLLRIRVKKSRARRMEEEAERNVKNVDFKGPYDLRDLDRLLGSMGKKVHSCASAAETNATDKSNLREETKNDDAHSTKESANASKSLETNGKNISANGEEEIGNLSMDENYEIPKLKVLGRVETEFKFQHLCDFQYLPIAKNVNDPTMDECIYDSVYPSTIPPYSWLKNKVPYFLPPPAFSRMDSIQQYSLKTENEKGPDNIIGKTRKRRPGFSNLVHFDHPETPEKPPPGIETARKLKFLQQSHLERMRKIFEERPVWSRIALTSVTDFTSDQLKYLLPSVAYHFTTGPWRILWVRLGYDPRKDPQARKYQTLDYRLKAMHGLESKIKSKRTIFEHALPYKMVPSTRPRTTILTSMDDVGDNQTIEKIDKENDYIYREGIIPPSRQMFYQYCDVHVDEIQEMLAKLPNLLPGVKCHPKRGWLPSGFSDQCREMINRQVRTVLRKQMNIPEDHPTALPPKRLLRRNFSVARLTSEKSTASSSSRKNKTDKRKEPEDSDSDSAHMDSDSN